MYNELNGKKELPDFTYVTEPIIGDGLKEKMRAAAAGPDRFFLPIGTIRSGSGNGRMDAVPMKAKHCYDEAGRLLDWVLDWDYGITEVGQGPPAAPLKSSFLAA